MAFGAVERSRRSNRQRGLIDRGVGFVLLALAGGWAAYVGPSAVAALVALPGDGAAQLVYSGESPTEDGWLRLLDSREAGLRFAERASLRRDLGVAYFVLADSFADDDALRRELLRRATAELAAALTRSPADPPTLAVLAEAYAELGDFEASRRWLDAARVLAPFSPETAFARLTTDLRSDRTPHEEAQLRDLRTAFARDRDGVAQLLLAYAIDAEILARIADESLNYELSVAVMRAREEMEASR